MKTEKEDEIKLSWFYRLILKLPKITLESASADLEGIYWAIMIPIFIVCEAFLSFFLLIAFPFPVNLVVTSIIPTAIFVVFVRVQLERFLNWWNLNVRSKPMKWDVKKGTEEYMKLLQKQRSKRQILGVSTYEKDRKEE